MIIDILNSIAIIAIGAAVILNRLAISYLGDRSKLHTQVGIQDHGRIMKINKCLGIPLGADADKPLALHKLRDRLNALENEGRLHELKDAELRNTLVKALCDKAE